jgi:hypothetical protein
MRGGSGRILPADDDTGRLFAFWVAAHGRKCIHDIGNSKKMNEKILEKNKSLIELIKKSDY